MLKLQTLHSSIAANNELAIRGSATLDWTVSKENNNEHTIEISDHMMFESNSQGTRELMERFNSGGKISWYYSSVGKVNSLKLGLNITNGVETVYFLSKPQEEYQIHYSKIEFSLMTGSRSQEFKQVSTFLKSHDTEKNRFIGKWNHRGFVLQISDAGNGRMNVVCIEGGWNMDYANAKYVFKNGRIEFNDKTFERTNYFTLESDGRLKQSNNATQFEYYEKL